MFVTRMRELPSVLFVDDMAVIEGALADPARMINRPKLKIPLEYSKVFFIYKANRIRGVKELMVQRVTRYTRVK